MKRTLGTSAISLATVMPRPPQPISPTCTRSLAPTTAISRQGRGGDDGRGLHGVGEKIAPFHQVAPISKPTGCNPWALPGFTEVEELSLAPGALDAHADAVETPCWP